MKSHSTKFWIFVWLIAGAFLVGWFLFWNTTFKGMQSTAATVMKLLPIEAQQKKEYETLAALGDAFLKKDNTQRSYLVLFQNNLELRPGGGFIGAVAVVNVKNGKVVSFATQDLSKYPSLTDTQIQPPYPLKDVLRVNSWNLRDVNFSPDFAANAQNAQLLYNANGQSQQFDGVVGITANMLTSLLKVTGPIQIPGYPGTYDSDNAIISLEYQVEKAYSDQGLSKDDRKSVINDLANEIEKKIRMLSVKQKIALAKILIEDLRDKDIQLYFSNPQLQQTVEGSGWAGRVNDHGASDFLMAVDANLGSFKSDYYMKRSMDYTVDFTGNVPMATLKITYQHTAQQKDWMTRDYLTYLRVYVPSSSWLTQGVNFNSPQFGNEFGKKYFGAVVTVPIGQTKTIVLTYKLPDTITENNYQLYIQKQAGITDEAVSTHVILKNGSRQDKEIVLN